MSEHTPKPGIYPGISFDEYCGWDALNHSRLCRIDKSPRHCQELPDFEKSAAIRLGQLVHCGRLETDSVLKRYAVMPGFELMPENKTADGKPSKSPATTFVKQKQSEFRAQERHKTAVSGAEFAKYCDALEAITQNRTVVDMVNDGTTELSIVWDDANTGLRCKARIDCQTESALMDLKTSRDDGSSPLPESFEYSLWQYNYYTQAAFYQEGWRVLTGRRLPFWFAVVGTNRPMMCVAAPVGEMSLMLGRDKNIERLGRYAACKDANFWPGYVSPKLFELPERYFPNEDVTL